MVSIAAMPLMSITITSVLVEATRSSTVTVSCFARAESRMPINGIMAIPSQTSTRGVVSFITASCFLIVLSNSATNDAATMPCIRLEIGS